MQPKEILNIYLPTIEEEIKAILSVPNQSLASYYGMMRYHLGWVDEGLQPTKMTFDLLPEQS